MYSASRSVAQELCVQVAVALQSGQQGSAACSLFDFLLAFHLAALHCLYLFPPPCSVSSPCGSCSGVERGVVESRVSTTPTGMASCDQAVALRLLFPSLPA